MCPRNKSQTVYMQLLGQIARSTLGISHRDSFTLKVVNKTVPDTIEELNLAAMSPPG